MMLALPGSAYLYQGEELGLLEVADLPVGRLQDPVWERTGHTLKGRDGAASRCRGPRPEPPSDSASNGSWLPQPHWFARVSVQAQDGSRTARCRCTGRHWPCAANCKPPTATVVCGSRAPTTSWISAGPTAGGGITNFSHQDQPLPEGEILLSSGRSTTATCCQNHDLAPRPGANPQLITATTKTST